MGTTPIWGVGDWGDGTSGPSGGAGNDTGSYGLGSLGSGASSGGWSGLLKMIPGLANIGAQVGGAAVQQGNTNKAANYIQGVGNTASGQNATNFSNANNAYGQQSGALQGILNSSNPYIQQLNTQLGSMANMGGLNGVLSSLVQQGQNIGPYGQYTSNQLYQDPNSINAQTGITDLTGNTSGMLNFASQLMNSGGITNTQVPLGDYAKQLMSGGSPYQQALSGAGTGILSSGGMTPALQSALSQATGVVGNSGQTDLTNQLASMGIDLAGKNPLLSGAQAASIAEDQSGRNYSNAAKNAREQANIRGQGAGASVANGAGNSALAEMGDTALANTATAANQARLGQESLGLQQQQQGLNTALGSAGLQQGLELGGLGAIGNLTNSATNQLGTGGGLVNSAANQANQGGNLYNSLLGLQQGNVQQGINAGTSAIGQQSNLLQTALQNILQGQNGAAGIGSNLANLLLGNQGQQTSAIGQGLNSSLSAAGQFGGQGSSYLGGANSALGTYGSTGNAMSQLMQQPNPYASVLNNAGGSGAAGGLVGSILSGLGGLFGL